MRLLEPALGPLDYAFLVVIAPLLCWAVAGARDVSAGWHAYLCVAYFWRSRVSVAVAVALSVTCHFLASTLGVFGWRRWVQGLGLPPAPEASFLEVALLVPGAGVLLSLDPRTRLSVVAVAFLFSEYSKARANEAAVLALEHYMRLCIVSWYFQ